MGNVLAGGGLVDNIFNGSGNGSLLGGAGGLLGFMTHPFQSIMLLVGGIILLVILYKILVA